MFVAALIVLVIAVLLLLAGIFGGTGNSLDVGPIEVENASAMFFLGMACLLLFVLSLGMLRAAARSASKRRTERKKVGELSKQLDEYKREKVEENPSDQA